MKPIFIAASPNTQSDDVWVSIKQLLQPWKWYAINKTEKFEKQMAEYLGNEAKAVALDSARSAFYLLLKAYGIGAGDEVILPSFSCLVIANPVLWVGAKPVYVDIHKNNFNIDLSDLKTRVTQKTKAILVQHTFGIPVDINAVRKIVGENVKIIEDCAHALGGELNGKKLGTLGDAAVFTFGIEKAISTVRGGMVAVNDNSIYQQVLTLRNGSRRFPLNRVFISLLNPVLWKIITPLYYAGIGKITVGRLFTFIAHKLNLLGLMIESCEYRTEKPKWIPARMPGALAALGANQLQKIAGFVEHRKKISSLYIQELHLDLPKNIPMLRVPFLTKNKVALLGAAKKQRIVLGDWYKNILYAPESSLKLLQYNQGDTPKAEKVSKEMVNLPTAINVSEADAWRIIELVRKFG